MGHFCALLGLRSISKNSCILTQLTKSPDSDPLSRAATVQGPFSPQTFSSRSSGPLQKSKRALRGSSRPLLITCLGWPFKPLGKKKTYVGSHVSPKKDHMRCPPRPAESFSTEPLGVWLCEASICEVAAGKDSHRQDQEQRQWLRLGSPVTTLP